jgi:hypothetical protein
MEINPLIQIDTVTKPDVIGKAQADAVFDRGSTIHAQDQPVNDSSYSHADDRGNPSKQKIHELFENISKNGRGLAVKIQPDAT